MIPALSGAQDGRVITLEGEAIPADIVRIAEGKASAEDGREFALDSLRAIIPPEAGGAEPPQAPFVRMVNGGVLEAPSAVLEGERVRFDHPVLGQVSLGIDSLHALALRAPAQESRFDKAIRSAPGGRQDDVLFLTDPEGGEPQEAEGLTESLSEGKVVFDRAGELADAARADLFGIVFAAPAAEGPPPARVVLAKGGTAAGEILGMDAAGLRLRLGPGAEVTARREDIRRIALNSPRLVFLSDLEPAAAGQEPIIAPERPAQMDRSAEGSLITVGGELFEKGIGVGSGSRLAFSLDPSQRFALFTAAIGIDDETGGKGDCEFTVWVDGQERLRQRCRGGDPARRIRVDVSGARQLELRVEAGEDLDLADHADWADASLVRAK
ncbi:MAG: NPCBM/NEW2 domain-containing protein [Verrucomicrobiales bacterium]